MSDSNNFLLNPILILGFFLSVEACKRITEGKKPRYLLDFNFIFWFNNHSLSEKNYSWNQWKWPRLPDKVLEYTCRLRWLISPTSMFSCCWFRRCRLASNRHGVRLPNLISHMFTASGRVKEHPFCLKGTAEARSNFACARTVLFPDMHRFNFLSGPLGISALLELILFIFFFLYPLQRYY